MGMIARVLRAEKEPTEPAYPDLVLISARNYASALKEGRHRFSDVGRAACDRLVATIETGIERRTELRPSDIAFDARSLDGITAEDRVQFVNQFVLGTGWDGSPILVMGTEAAEDYEAGDAEELAFHCLYVVLQLAGGSIEILQAMAVGSTWGTKVKDWTLPRRRYDFEPNDLLQLNMGRPRTWRILAEVATGSTDRAAWNTMFEQPRTRSRLGRGHLSDRTERPFRAPGDVGHAANTVTTQFLGRRGHSPSPLERVHTITPRIWRKSFKGMVASRRTPDPGVRQFADFHPPHLGAQSWRAIHRVPRSRRTARDLLASAQRCNSARLQGTCYRPCPRPYATLASWSFFTESVEMNIHRLADIASNLTRANLVRAHPRS